MMRPWLESKGQRKHAAKELARCRQCSCHNWTCTTQGTSSELQSLRQPVKAAAEREVTWPHGIPPTSCTRTPPHEPRSCTLELVGMIHLLLPNRHSVAHARTNFIDSSTKAASLLQGSPTSHSYILRFQAYPTRCCGTSDPTLAFPLTDLAHPPPSYSRRQVLVC